jgi:elongation factor P
MISTSEFKRGLKIEMDGVPYEIVEFLHFKPGKGGAMIRTKLRNLLTGKITDNTFRSGEKVGKPDFETREMQYLYKEGDSYVLMDMTSYEQVYASEDQVGGKGGFLKDGETVKVLLYNGEPIDVDLPASVVMQVAETEPGMKGDTVSGATKPAVLETGITVQVPLFIDEGDQVKVDTRSGEYLGRE